MHTVIAKSGRGLAALLAAAVAAVACSSGGGASACTQNADCGAGARCVYRIGSCLQAGECRSTGGSTCGAIQQVCGCGQIVATGCGFPDGYASGPTTGDTQCR